MYHSVFYSLTTVHHPKFMVANHGKELEYRIWVPVQVFTQRGSISIVKWLWDLLSIWKGAHPIDICWRSFIRNNNTLVRWLLVKCVVESGVQNQELFKLDSLADFLRMTIGHPMALNIISHPSRLHLDPSSFIMIAALYQGRIAKRSPNDQPS